MVKNLDGIKKLNPEEIKKYRKIVLNYIGEKDSAGVNEQKNSSQGISSSRRVDGVNLNKANRSAIKNKLGFKKPSSGKDLPSTSLLVRPVEPVDILDAKKAELAEASRREAERLKEAIKRQEEERRKIKEEERQYQIKQEQAEQDQREQAEKQRLENIRLEQEKIKQEKNRYMEIEKRKRALAEEKIRQQQELVRQEELKKKGIAREAKREAEAIKQAEEAKKWAEKMRLIELEKAENRRVRENIRLVRLKRQEEIAKMKLERKIARQAAKEKKRSKRQKVWRKIKKNLNFKLNNLFSKIKHNVIYIVSFSALFLAVAYVIFCLAALRFNNNMIGRAANYLPVPAVITSQGIISYNDLRKIEDKNYLSLNLAEKENYFAKRVILRSLEKKYGLPANTAEDSLATKYILDKDFNQIGLSRINKINELSQGQSEFEQLGKYADESSDGAYYSRASVIEQFGPMVLELAIGQISGIIFRADGYYIIKRVADKKSQLGLKYIFIKAFTLDQYVFGRIGKIKVFILAN